jgi:peptide/nickel transport system substrate-binding protein
MAQVMRWRIGRGEPRRRMSSGRRRGSGVALLALVALAACACTSVASGKPTAASNSGVVKFAETPGIAPTWIFPMFPPQYFTIQDQSWFEYLSFPPLYVFGEGGNPGLDYETSLGLPPVYSDGDTAVTIKLKHWVWSDGQPVTTRDLTFWINLIKGDPADWGSYVPGGFPDNIKSVQVQSPYELTLHLTKAYSPTYFTDNQLSQLTPIPQHAWDKTSSSGSVGNYDETPSGAKTVYNFLAGQSKDLSTYGTNPLWKVVDGPWQMSAYDTSGLATFVPNKKYSGPNKPRLKEFQELPFATQADEYTAVVAKQVDYGFVPPSELASLPRLKSQGDQLSPWKLYGFNGLLINFNNPTVGPIFKQLYARQALEELIDQPEDIKEALGGYGQPTYGPVVNGPSDLIAPAEKTPLYPYDPQNAAKLFAEHGWTKGSGTTLTCSDPAKCGPGIKNGAALQFGVQIYTADPSQSIEMEAFESAGAKIGVSITIQQVADPYVTALACKPTQSSCSWEMSDFGGYPYTGGIYYPIGTGYFDCNASKNHQSYCDPKEDQLDQQAELPSGSIMPWETYVAQQIPMLWIPNGDFQYLAADGNLKGIVPTSTRLSIFPQDWYYSS